MTPEDSPIRVAVIGAGPAGFYAAGHLLKDSAGRIEVDMLERLPTPWGLVRSGVAPDHPKIKSVTRVYEKTAEHPRFRYFGNVEFGRHVSRDELLEHYHAIVYATGAPTDRPLGIPGEELPGSWPATDFVGWYNGHPDHPDLDFDLDCERAVVIGNGNVALDVARMLTLSHAELACTDTADHALEALERSRVREVVVLGAAGRRRRPLPAPSCASSGNLPTPTSSSTARSSSARYRFLIPARARPPGRTSRSCAIMPSAFRGTRGDGLYCASCAHPSSCSRTSDGRVAAVRLARNELLGDSDGRLRAQSTGELETIPTGLVLRAIGYRGLPLPGVPFDEARGVIHNECGRVLGPDCARRGEYAVGWIKRGPTGVIGTNKKDAQQTVDAIFEDLAAGLLHDPPRPDPAELEETLSTRQPDLVTYAAWSEIDRYERERGELAGRPRVKLTSIEEMLRIAAEESPTP